MWRGVVDAGRAGSITEAVHGDGDSSAGFLHAASGLAFWTSNITTCGADANCIEVKRINVSAAFYLFIEFQQTGYLVERIYKAAYGDANGSSTLGGSHCWRCRWCV